MDEKLREEDMTGQESQQSDLTGEGGSEAERASAAAGAPEAGESRDLEGGEAGAAESEKAEERKAGAGQAETAEEPARPRQPTYIETLERKLQESHDKLREYIQAYKQVKEETEEFKARMAREKEKELDILRGRLVSQLFEVLDNLDRSVQGAESTGNLQAMIQGIKMVRGQFLDKLMGFGLELIEPIGQDFDPNEAEAVMLAPAQTPDEDGKVVQVFARGYRMKDRVIRAAQVQVARLSDGD